MNRSIAIAALLAASAGFLSPTVSNADGISGTYLETRTCQVYTGPCFANGEVGLCGRDAIMAWNIEQGEHDGVALDGLSVVVVVNASTTLGFGGINGVEHIKSVILVDETASVSQRQALVNFAKQHSSKAGDYVVRVDSSPISMSLDTETLAGRLEAGKVVKVVTRKANPGDCICSNESAYYPPLAEVENFAPGVTLQGSFSGRGLNSRWTTPDARSAYMATFAY